MKKEEVFNECLEQLLAGNSVDDCLKARVEQAREIEPLLRASQDIGRRASSIHATPSSARFRVRLAEAMMAREAAKRPHPQWRPRWAVAVSAVLTVVIVFSGMAAVSADSQPDSPLYPVKLASEQVRLAFAFARESKARVYVRLAEERASEIAYLAQAGKSEQRIPALAAWMESHLDNAVKLSARPSRARPGVAVSPGAPKPVPGVAPGGKSMVPRRGEGTGTELREQMEHSAARSLEKLEQARQKAPQWAKPAVE
ncbi:MAG: DUF5667 domain-containing protein, partial [Chloroflexota bacterium]